MKTVCVISYLLGLAMIFAACSEPDHLNITNEEVEYQELSMSAELSGQPFTIMDGSTIDLTGTTNCNLANNTCVSVYGIVRNLQNGNFAIEHGSLRILAPDQGCYLTGNFDGWGKNFINDMAMGATVEVFCGTGAFQADGGELQLKITGMDSNGNFKTEIFGQLKRLKEQNEIDLDIVHQEKFHLEAEVIGKSIAQQANIKLDVPAASSCSVGEAVSVSIFAAKDHHALSGDCKLPYGQIDFINPSSGCYMTGKLSGDLSNDSGGCFIEATIDIDRGVGIFQADGGSLRLTIKGKTVADEKMNYTIEIDGYLEHRDS